MKKKKLIRIGLILVLGQRIFAGGVARYALYIGSNNGGRSRESLVYAGSDAESLKETMSEIGGIADTDSILLINPTDKEVNQALKKISAKIEAKKTTASRTEFFFYYSGHSDEDALLLGEKKYDYGLLKEAISSVPSDIHVVILDSCYSGNFIRKKGGMRKLPFMMDDSSVVKGYAYLSSSSETESSQESDEIGASYFTNALVTGLRGAADTSGDKKVTLNELYSYAFNDTLRKTEETKAGPQHPNYNITLVGSGDLILSDFSESNSVISIAQSVKGRIILRNSAGKLISEINKNEDAPVLLALVEGDYSVIIIEKDEVYGGNITVKKDEDFILDTKKLTKIELRENMLRGRSKFNKDDIDENSWAYYKAMPNLIKGNYDFILYTSNSFKRPTRINNFILRDNMEMYSDLPLFLSLKTNAIDYLLKSNEQRNTAKYNFIFGCELNCDLLDKQDSTKLFSQIYFSPCFGMTFEDDYSCLLPLEGFGIYIYPISFNYLFTNMESKSFYKCRSSLALEANYCITANWMIGLEGRLDCYWKDYKIDPRLYVGWNIGRYYQCKKSWDKIKKLRMIRKSNGKYQYIPVFWKNKGEE